MMLPSLGRIVHYKMSDWDVDALRASDPSTHRNAVVAGQVCPAMIVRVWGETETSAVNLQVYLDGDCSYWATSRVQGDEPGQWSAPPRVG